MVKSSAILITRAIVITNAGTSCPIACLHGISAHYARTAVVPTIILRVAPEVCFSSCVAFVNARFSITVVGFQKSLK